MIRILSRRLARLERAIGPPGSSNNRVTVIVIRGGLPAPIEHHGMYAEAGGDLLLSFLDEPLPALEDRSIQWAAHLGENIVIIAGVPKLAPDDRSSGVII
jgi:hypothetical protein